VVGGQATRSPLIPWPLTCTSKAGITLLAKPAVRSRHSPRPISDPWTVPLFQRKKIAKKDSCRGPGRGRRVIAAYQLSHLGLEMCKASRWMASSSLPASRSKGTNAKW